MSKLNTPNPTPPVDVDDVGPGGIMIVPVATYGRVLSELKRDRKISAIKACRGGYLDLTGRRISLRSAKNAVERLRDEMLSDRVQDGDSRPRLRTSLSISAVIVNTGTEKVEVDLEELQLRILSDVGTLGLAECGRILEIVEVFEAWNSGKRVGVLKEA